MKHRKFVTPYYVSDFETTTDNPDKVAVWSAHTIKVGKGVECTHENCAHQTNIADYVAYLEKLTRSDDITVLFHNLKFDGSYIIDYMEKSPDWNLYSIDFYEPEFEDRETLLLDRTSEMGTKGMKSHDFTYAISDKNVMYSITFKAGYHFCTIRDSLKLLPFSLRKIAKDFNTPHQKLEMDYGNKQPGYVPTPEEMAYIDNDVFVLKEALEIFMTLTGHDEDGELPWTIGAECLREIKQIFKDEHMGEWDPFFPSQFDAKCGSADNFITMDEYVRRSYKGGWCYVNDKWKGIEITTEVVENYFRNRGMTKQLKHLKQFRGIGFVYDVNSLYPSQMHSKSGSFYPYGNGKYAEGDITPEERKYYDRKRMYYFIHIQCEFQLKKDHLPCIQIKNDMRYPSTEWLKSSDVTNYITGKRTRNIVDLYLSCIDYELFLEQYDVKNLKVISHISYSAFSGIFDTYIGKWYKIKQVSKGAKRATSKLFLNNGYGKFAQAPDGSYIILLPEDNVLKSHIHKQGDPNRAIYIPIGAAVTSWARNFTIRHAQENYDIFVYADTDSLHMLGHYTDAIDIEEHPTNLCCWKCESTWDHAIFAGQKRYIEHVIEDDHSPIEPFNNIKCCGLGDKAKKVLDVWLNDGTKTYSDFKRGLIVPGNLKGRRVEGGIYLNEQPFRFR